MAGKDRDEVKQIPSSIRRAVRKMHRGLGHPSREAFLKMLRLGGASTEAIRYAKIWECPICAASAMPQAPKRAVGLARPFGFNEHVVADLKYVHDARDSRFVLLSIVDAGTCFHVAGLLKNRKPPHVSKRFFELWVAHYGAPRRLSLDQGVEFAGEFATSGALRR